MSEKYVLYSNGVQIGGPVDVEKLRSKGFPQGDQTLPAHYDIEEPSGLVRRKETKWHFQRVKLRDLEDE